MSRLQRDQPNIRVSIEHSKTCRTIGTDSGKRMAFDGTALEMNNSTGTIASLNYLFTVVREDPSMEHVIDRIPDHQFRIVGAVRQTEARGQILRLIEVVIVTVAGILVRRVE